MSGNLIKLHNSNGAVYIPVHKITGMCVVGPGIDCGKTFIATGPDDVDGGENGWYVLDDIEDVRNNLEFLLITLKPPKEGN